MLVVKGNEEPEFYIVDLGSQSGDDGIVLVVHVHPWERILSDGDTDRSVFISVGWEHEDDGTPWEDPSGCESVWNTIVDRDEFIAGLLKTFPELKRA